ncbi:S-adenosyl-L-methionine-dependentmethyltransferases superfamily protein, partial [Striga asiatica]
DEEEEEEKENAVEKEEERKEEEEKQEEEEKNDEGEEEEKENAVDNDDVDVEKKSPEFAQQVVNTKAVDEEVLCMEKSPDGDGDEAIEEEDDEDNVPLQTRRLRYLSKNVSSPFVNLQQKDEEDKLSGAYNKWMHTKDDARLLNVGQSPKFLRGRDYFEYIEGFRKSLSQIHIDPFLEAISRRLYTKKGKATISSAMINIQDATLFSLLENEWRKLGCPYKKWNDSNEWKAPQGIVKYVRGKAVGWGKPWLQNSNVVLVCNVGDHWMVCRVVLEKREIHVYDSLAHNSEDILGREETLAPLTHLLPPLLQRLAIFALWKTWMVA